LRLGQPDGSLFLTFSDWKFVGYAFLIFLLRATCHAHLYRHDLIILIICDEEYKSWRYSLRNFLHPPVNSSNLGQILFSALISQTLSMYVGFQVLTAASMKMTIFWNAAPCSLAEVYRRFRGASFLHHQGEPSSYSPPWEPDISPSRYVRPLWQETNFHTHQTNLKQRFHIIWSSCFCLYKHRFPNHRIPELFLTKRENVARGKVKFNFIDVREVTNITIKINTYETAQSYHRHASY
jgi:hypothetical protein